MPGRICLTLTMVVIRRARRSRTVGVKRDKVKCRCGAVFEVGPDPEGVPMLEVGKVVYMPQLVAVGCPKCGAEVRLDRGQKRRRAK